MMQCLDVEIFNGFPTPQLISSCYNMLVVAVAHTMLGVSSGRGIWVSYLLGDTQRYGKMTGQPDNNQAACGGQYTTSQLILDNNGV